MVMYVSRRNFLKSVGLVAGGTLIKGRINLETVRLREMQWQTGQDIRVCLVQLSDIHIHQNTWTTGGADVLRETKDIVMNLRKICKEAGYELVIALTGDQVTCTKWRGLRSETDGDYFKKQQRFFETLASTQAIIMALKGNHDNYISWTNSLMELLEGRGVRYLAPGDEFIGNGYKVFGLPDWQTEKNVLDTTSLVTIQHHAEAEQPTLLLGHNAEIMNCFASDSRRNTLLQTGHVHGYSPWYAQNIMGYTSPYTYGTYHLGNNTHVQVSGGIGTTSESCFRGLGLSSQPEVVCTRIH